MDLAPFVGLPYEHRGRSYEGCDCWGLVQIFYKDVMNIEVPDYRLLYSDTFDKDECGKAIEMGSGEWAEVDDLSFGTVLTFNILGAVCHVGVHTGDGDFIHSFNGTDSCIESVRDISWSKRLHKAYEWQTNRKH